MYLWTFSYKILIELYKTFSRLDIKKEAKIWDILKNIGVDEKSDLKREEQEKEIRENNQKLNNK